MSNTNTNDGAVPAASVEVPPAVQDPIVPYPGYWADFPAEWLRFANALKQEAHQADPQVVFIGDSITQAWGSDGKATWDARFAPLGAVNVGIGGDKTNQILWRIADGLLDGLHPRLVVLKIGVNNLWNDQHGAERISEGIAACVAAVRQKCPQARVLVLGILPTQQDPTSPLRAKVADINRFTSHRADNETVFYRDIGQAFVEPDGSISAAIMPDYLHLSPQGYAVFGSNLEPIVTELLG